MGWREKMTKIREQFLENVELVKLFGEETFDEVDNLKVVEKDGVVYLCEV